MALSLYEHPFFKPWKDKESGVESFILTERVAPVQQSFYFTNSSVSSNERWLWFYTAFPPSRQRSLGVVSLDADNPIIHHFPETTFSSASPMVAEEGDAVYFCMGRHVWRKSIDNQPEVVCTLSEDFIDNRVFNRLATHLTLSTDGRYFLLDGAVGNHWFVGLGDRKSGEVRILKEFARNYNHAQFSPTDPELFLIAQDWWHDPITGQRFSYDHRTWLMNVKKTRFEPICPRDWDSHTSAASHEWWTADGLICWVDYQKGVFEYDIEKKQKRKVWQGPLCHAHCDSKRQQFCADQSPYNWEKTGCQVRFYDRRRGKEINIVTSQPLPPYPRGWYHIDPHPQFSPKDTWVTYTTTVRGKVDLSLTPVRNILDSLR